MGNLVNLPLFHLIPSRSALSPLLCRSICATLRYTQKKLCIFKFGLGSVNNYRREHLFYIILYSTRGLFVVWLPVFTSVLQATICI